MLDGMFGYNTYDFEARAYDPTISRFTTMDPLAEKYYSISPYAYCNNNPVNAVDPDGKDIRILYNMDKNQYVWNFDGTNSGKAPENQFVKVFLLAYTYNIINGGGEKLKEAATTKDYSLNLFQTEDNSYFTTTFNGPRTEGSIFWNPSEGLETSMGTLSPATILEHEFDHGVQWQTQTVDYLKGRDQKNDHFKNEEEKRVIMGSEYKTGLANRELQFIPKTKMGNSSSYRRHGENSGNTFIPVISPISNKRIK